MLFRLLVGLPSYCEADAIAKVTADIDAALASLPFPADALLANADNSSPDGTAAVFLATPTRCRKTALTTPHAAGKGTNMRALLALAVDQDVDAVLFADTDLAEVPNTWIHALVGAIHDGADFCYPLRPPTWNGGDLTYQLAYPLLAGAFGVDFREPLCGEIALSTRAARLILKQQWTPSELRFGVDFLIASVAATQPWKALPLADRRRNKLRSFSTVTNGEYRMGAKFAEVSAAVAHRVALRLDQPPPAQFVEPDTDGPAGNGVVVPTHDPDIAELAESTSRRLRTDAKTGTLSVFPKTLADRLHEHAKRSAEHGLSWDDWRDCLFAWIRQERTAPDNRIPVELLETLFLNRVVGHHREIAGTTDWYSTVRHQAQDVFAHRHGLWPRP